MDAQITETISEKEAEIARLQGEVARLKDIKPEPSVGAVVRAVGVDGEDYFINVGDQGDGRDWLPLSSFWEDHRRNRGGGAKSLATTWLSISSTYPTVYVATWSQV